MTDAPDPIRKPDRADKAARQAAMLRANLGRRKAQKRARGAEDKAAHMAAPDTVGQDAVAPDAVGQDAVGPDAVEQDMAPEDAAEQDR